MKYKVVIKKDYAKDAVVSMIDAQNLTAAKRIAGRMLAQRYKKAGQDRMTAWLWDGDYRYEKRIYVPYGKADPVVTRWTGACHITISQ